MKMRRVLKISGTLLLVFLAWIIFNTSYIWRDYIFPPPVEFQENDYIRLGLYPSGAVSATVFTNDDFSAEVPLAESRRLREWLQQNNLPMTFFVIPLKDEVSRLEEGERVELLRQLRDDGHEIAQHGLAHYCGRNVEEGVQDGAEMLLLDRGESIERLARGRNILRELGFDPLGHRSPCFSGTPATISALEELEFLYGSDCNLPATTPKTLLLPDFWGRIMFPFHPDGMELLEVTGQIDPTVKPGKARKVFERFHPRGGVIVYLTHLPDIGEPDNLKELGRFLEYVREHNTWICRFDELVRWWIAREKARVEVDGENILMINPTSYPLDQAQLEIKKSGPYRILLPNGELLAEGIGPELILVDIPGQE